MDNRIEADRWFAQAEADLASARDSRAAHHYEWACFQSQQAGEKALKSLLYRRGRRGMISHSLRELMRLAISEGVPLEALEQATHRLDTFYIPTRYPDSLPGNDIPATFYTHEEGEQCLADAELILTTVKNFLNA